MDFWKKCPLLLLLVVGGLLITIVGAVNRNGVYSDYERKTVMTPILAAVFEGIKEGKYPWPEGQPEQEFVAQEDAQHSEGTEPARETKEDLAAQERKETETGEEQERPDKEQTLETGQENQEPVQNEPEAASETDREESLGQETAPKEPVDGSEGEEAHLQTEVHGAKQAPQDGGEAVNGQEAQPDEGEPEDRDREFVIGRVEEDYFEDALFIGDSRTQGLYEYGGFSENVTFYCKTSLTIYDLFKKEKAFIKEEEGSITLEQALTKRSFGKIYLMIGINEMGTGTPESFFEEYARVVYRIRQLQPDAVIFVQAIMNVGGKKSAADPVFNNLNIAIRNVEIETLADNKTIFYIDVNEVLCDENGNLFDGWSNDQIHLKAKYYAVWKEFLMNHGAVEIVEK